MYIYICYACSNNSCCSVQVRGIGQSLRVQVCAFSAAAAPFRSCSSIGVRIGVRRGVRKGVRKGARRVYSYVTDSKIIYKIKNQ